jgi:IclR family pca regulon transcriptional regulator
VLLATLTPDELERALAEPSRSGITPRWNPDLEERNRVLHEVRARGWALADEQLAAGIRSVAAPVRDNATHVVAALNVSVHAAETSIETLTERYLPLLLQTAEAISSDWTLRAVPEVTIVAGRRSDCHPRSAQLLPTVTVAKRTPSRGDNADVGARPGGLTSREVG